MTQASVARRRVIPWIWLAVAIAALALGFGAQGPRVLVTGALAQLKPAAVLATIPGQVAACLLCGLALHGLCPTVSFRDCVIARLLRDAGANLLLFLPGLGEMIGARALVLAGGQTRQAITASILDNLTEIVAQIPYGVLAIIALPVLWHMHVPWPRMDGGLPWLLGLSAAALAAALSWFGGRHRAGRIGVIVGREYALLKAQLSGQRRGVPMAFLAHLLAWAMGGVQLWMAAGILSFPLGLFAAIVIDSLAYAGRGIAFFVPAGLGVQEAALVFAGVAYGLTPAQSLALALILRLRDILFGLPLLLWPLLEMRKRN